MNWTLDSGDWRCRSASDSKACARQVLDLIRPGDVVLFHDNHEWIDAILDVELPALVSSPLVAGRASDGHRVCDSDPALLRPANNHL